MSEHKDTDRRIKSIGRKLSPVYRPGREANKSRFENYNELSKKSLQMINEKHKTKTIKTIHRIVSDNLQVINTVL
jgi:hypothetical protein